jgi:hypothetical protein
MEHTNYLDILPSDCMDKIQLYVLNLSTDDIDTSIKDLIKILNNYIKVHYIFLVNSQTSENKLKVASELIALRKQLILM